jgi:hypothetical protein
MSVKVFTGLSVIGAVYHGGLDYNGSDESPPELQQAATNGQFGGERFLIRRQRTSAHLQRLKCTGKNL